jgi:hypothetical protein
VAVIGSFRAFKLPSWTCYLDGHSLINNIPPNDLNNVEICSLTDILPKATPNNLTVQVSGTTDNPDRTQYEPDDSIVPDNATVVVGAIDDQIGYHGWISLNGNRML